jgi:hypothetical protein
MRNFRRQFGKTTAEIAKKSPTLVADIAEIREKGVKIRRIFGPCQACYDRKKWIIYISWQCPKLYKLVSIAHEFVHALVKPSKDPIPGETGRQEFINACLEEETEAICHEIQIVREFLAAGVPVEEKELIWLNRYRYGGGKANIRRWLEKTITSTTGETYPEYYGEWYDEVIPKKMRLP